MSTLHEAIRAQLDNYAASDPSDGDYGTRFRREQVAPEVFTALTDILDYAEGLGTPFVDTIYGYVAAALGVSTEPAQPTVADLDNCPHGQPWGTCKEAHRGDRCQCNPRRDLCNCDGTVIENCPCYKHLLMPPWPPAEVVPAQAEPRVWQPGDRVQWLRYSDDTITDTGTVVERDTQQWPGHVPVLPDYYRDGPRPLTHPVYINPKHLSEVTDQAGEAR